MAEGSDYMDNIAGNMGRGTIGNVRYVGHVRSVRGMSRHDGHAIVGSVPQHGRTSHGISVPGSGIWNGDDAPSLSSLVDVSMPDEYVQDGHGDATTRSQDGAPVTGIISHVGGLGGTKRLAPRSVRPLTNVAFAADESMGHDAGTMVAMRPIDGHDQQVQKQGRTEQTDDADANASEAGVAGQSAVLHPSAKQSRTRRAVRGILAASCAVLGMASLGIGYMTILVPDGGTTADASVMSQTADLGDGSKGEADAGSGIVSTDGIDWTGLRKRNSDIRAWMRVSSNGTDISQPVVYPSGNKASGWYLRHGLDNESTLLGVPFIDQRDGDKAGNLNLLVYGHHFAGSTKMFSSLNKANEQASFDKVSSLTWSTEDGGDETYVPVMAMAVDKTYQKVQRFGITDVDYLRTWLRSMESDATAKAKDADAIIAKATKVVTTVTCESDQPNEPGRVLVVFAKVG